MSKVGDSSGEPRAVIHKRILDVAASRPDASMADIADEISGATPDLVERVLGEYGDPGDQQSEEETPMAEQTPTQNGERAEKHAEQGTGESSAEQGNANEEDQSADPKPEEVQLTTKQRETARLVHETPEASQGNIADRLGVTRATVSRRLNDIPGFEWKHRRAFTESLFGRPAGDASAGAGNGGQADGGSDQSASENRQADQPTEMLAQFDERLRAVEAQLEDISEESAPGQSDEGTGLPPGLAHKVVHAAMESDRVSEDEELQLLKALLD